MDETYLTVAQVAELLKLNPQTVRNMVDRGELDHVRVGARRVRIRQSDLDAFLKASTEARRAQINFPFRVAIISRYKSASPC